MVSGAGSGGVDRIGGAGRRPAARSGPSSAARGRSGRSASELMSVYAEEQRPRTGRTSGCGPRVRPAARPGPAASIGKVHQGALNQRIQLLAADLLGVGRHGVGARRRSYADHMPLEVKGMLRSRANTIEGGTTEVNKNILGERVLGLPREPDPWPTRPGEEIPASSMSDLRAPRSSSGTGRSAG